MDNNENQIKLSQYYIAYIDILGIKNAIKSDKSEEYLNKIKNLYDKTINLIKFNCEQLWKNKFLKLDTKVKIFSDNIVIAIKKEDFFENSVNDVRALYLLIFTSFFQVLALKYSLLLRGSFVIGDLYVDNVFIYGQALSTGYQLENSIAIFPRIIVNPKDIKYFLRSDYGREILYKGDDNIYYLNPFECYFKYIPDINQTNEILTKIKENLNLCINKTKDTKINQKICWFINMFNAFCLKYKYNHCIIDTSKYPYDPQESEILISCNRELIKNYIQN